MARTAGKKTAKKSAKATQERTVTIKLTPAQRAQLQAETNGVFTKATFTFGEKPIRPPEIKVVCSLKRVQDSPTK